MNKTNSDIKYTSASKKSQTMHPGKIIEAYIESVEMTTETLSKTLGIPTENLKSIMKLIHFEAFLLILRNCNCFRAFHQRFCNTCRPSHNKQNWTVCISK